MLVNPATSEKNEKLNKHNGGLLTMIRHHRNTTPTAIILQNSQEIAVADAHAGAMGRKK